MSRRTASAAAVALGAAVSLVALAPQADAVVAGTCTSATMKAAFSPGVTTKQQPIATTITAGKLTGCSGDAAIPSSSATFTGSLKSVVTATSAGQSCTAGTAKGKLNIKWANGQTTTVAITQKPVTTTSTPFDLRITGKVTAGVGLAEQATIATTVTLTPTAGTCLLTPLTAATLAGKITISKP